MIIQGVKVTFKNTKDLSKRCYAFNKWTVNGVDVIDPSKAVIPQRRRRIKNKKLHKKHCRRLK